MSIQYCDHHGHFDTDFHVEGCPRCQALGDADTEADRKLDERKLDEFDSRHP